MATPSTRNLCRFLINSAIQRCRRSDRLFRVVVEIKRSTDVEVQILVSDTGDVIDLSEFQGLMHPDFHEIWDGILSVSTTNFHDKEINHYRIDITESDSARKFVRLPSTLKKSTEFSGTEASLTIKEDFGCCVESLTVLCRKMLILKIPKIAIELIVELMDGSPPRMETVVFASEGVTLPPSTTNMERFTLGMEDYVFKHRNSQDMGCWSCYPNREYLKIGTGMAYNTEDVPNDDQMVEVVIVIATAADSSALECPTRLDFVTKVLYFQDFLPSPMPSTLLRALTNIKWKDYGLRVKSGVLDENGDAVIEWEDMQNFTYIELAIHCYQKRGRKHTTSPKMRRDRKLVKLAVKSSLDELKARYTGCFLSPHAVKIKKHVPELSRTIAGLILSSKDVRFVEECASLLKIQVSDLRVDGTMESSIREKMVSIIETNDRKPRKRSGEQTVLLFGVNKEYEVGSVYENYCDDDTLSQSIRSQSIR